MLTNLLKEYGFSEICFVGGNRIRDNVDFIVNLLLSDECINPTKEKDINSLSGITNIGIGVYESLDSVSTETYILSEISKAIFYNEKTLFVFNKNGCDYGKVIEMIGGQRIRHNHNFLLLDYSH